MVATDMMVEIANISRTFGGQKPLIGARAPMVHAVNGVDLFIRRGETLGIVGESGCGKSTLARMLVGLDAPTQGQILLDGEDMQGLLAADRRALSKRVQYVFQDPISSLNPRKTVRQILEDPLKHLIGLDAPARRARLDDLMASVNLRPEFLDRYPHEFSGGQAQRIGIARALAADPDLIVLDEPVSALDVSVQAQVLNLLGELKEKHDLTYVFISHDLAVVESLCDRVAVMYFGRVVEQGSRAAIFGTPQHPYTRLLLGSVPVPGRKAAPGEAKGTELPDPYNPPPGCAFAPRCPRAGVECLSAVPAHRDVGEGHHTACFFPEADLN